MYPQPHRSPINPMQPSRSPVWNPAWTLLYCCWFSFRAVALEKPTKKETVQYKATQLEQTVIDGESCKKLTGNVVLTKKDMTIQADQLLYYDQKERIEAQGYITVTHQEGAVIKADRLLHDKETKTLQVWDHITYRSDKATFSTDYLTYDIADQIGRFMNGGTLTEGDNTITSSTGTYNEKDKIATFQQNVVFTSPEYTLQCNTLCYNTVTQVATFQGPATLISKEGTLRADQGGTYKTADQEVTLVQSTIETEDLVVQAHVLEANRATACYAARGQVTCWVKKQDLLITGDSCTYDQNKQITEIQGHIRCEKKLEHDDVLYLVADTLVIQADESGSQAEKKEYVVRAYPNIKIYQSKMQGIAGSLVYHTVDATLHLVDQPVIWSHDTQLTADTIRVVIEEQTIQRMTMEQNALIIAQDAAGHYNQLKGHSMVASFQEKQIDCITVTGNCESIYFLMNEEDSAQLVGMNHLQCADMRVYMKDNALDHVTFHVQPSGTFYPPHLLNEELKKLAGFVWRGSEKPTQEDVVRPGCNTHALYKKFISHKIKE